MAICPRPTFVPYKVGIELLTETPTGDAGGPIQSNFRRIADLFDSFRPPSAPPLSSASITLPNPVAAKLSFGATHSIGDYANAAAIGQAAIDADQTFPRVVGSLVGIGGVLASDVTADPTGAYPAYSFADAATGALQLEINGTVVRTIDLTVLDAVSDSTTGFVLSAALTNQYFTGELPQNVPFRTGTWVASADQFRNGFNYIRIRHILTTEVRDTDYLTFVYDADTTSTAFTGETMDVTPTGTKYLSGVHYHTGGAGTYSVTIANAYKNTYSTATDAIRIVGRVTPITAQSIPIGAPEYEAHTLTISTPFDLVASSIVDDARYLNSGVTLQTTVKRSVQSTTTSTGATVPGLLVDGADTTNGRDIENFRSESYRLTSAADFDSTDIDGDWDSTASLVDNDGLQVYGGTLIYPSVDYSAINLAYPNPDYSGATGTRTFHRVFHNCCPDARPACRLFQLFFAGTGASFISAGDSFTTAAQMKVELKLPSQTGWLDAYNDATGTYLDGDGCRIPNIGQGRELNIPWGITTGNLNSSASGERLVMRLTVPEGWTGTISQIRVRFLY